MNLMKLLSGDGFVMYNREIAHEVSVNGAIIFGQLCSSYSYFQERGELATFDEKQYFYITSDKLEKYTALSYKQQSKAIKELERSGYIETKLKGLPATKYYRIVMDKLVQNLLGEIGETSEVNSSSPKKSNPIKSTFVEDETSATLDTDSFDLSAKLDSTLGQNKMLQKVNEIRSNNKTSKIKNINLDNYQEINKILDSIEFRSEMTSACSELYSEFAPGRYSKKQWNMITTQFVEEIIESGRYINIPQDKIKAYAYKSLLNITSHTDYKRSDEKAEYDEIMQELATTKSRDLPPHIYNWLEK